MYLNRTWNDLHGSGSAAGNKIKFTSAEFMNQIRKVESMRAWRSAAVQEPSASHVLDPRGQTFPRFPMLGDSVGDSSGAGLFWHIFALLSASKFITALTTFQPRAPQVALHIFFCQSASDQIFIHRFPEGLTCANTTALRASSTTKSAEHSQRVTG